MADFQAALAYTLANEGGFTNDSSDSGGATNWGITIGDYSLWRRQHGWDTTTVQDVKDMTRDEAAQIYLASYWNRANLGGIDLQSVATAIFDMGVNMGLKMGVEFAQRVVGVAVDGIIGPTTMLALNAIKDEKQFMIEFVGLVHGHYIGIVENNPKDSVFLRGWLSRAQRLMTLV